MQADERWHGIWLSKTSHNERRHCICNVFSRWLSTCQVIGRGRVRDIHSSQARKLFPCHISSMEKSRQSDGLVVLLGWRHAWSCIMSPATLLNRVLRLSIKKTSKRQIAGPVWGNKPLDRKNAVNFPHHDVILKADGHAALSHRWSAMSVSICKTLLLAILRNSVDHSWPPRAKWVNT